MANIQELREQRETLFKQAETLEAKGDALTAEETETWSNLVDQVASLDTKITQAEAESQAIEDRKAKMASLRDARTGQRRSAPNEPGLSDIRVGKARFEDDPKVGFKTLGDFLSNVRLAHTPGMTVRGEVAERLNYLAAVSGMGAGTGADGGFTIPPAYSTTIWDGAGTESESLLAMTDQFTVTGDSLTMLANAETSRATGSRYGGVQTYWIAEGDQVSASRPKFRQMKLEPQQLASLVYVTDKLLQNSQVALEQYVSRAMTDDINFTVGNAIINGTGVGQPKGILTGTPATNACRVKVSKESGQTADTIVSQNVLKMYARLHPRARQGAVWFYNVAVTPQLNQMSLSVGTGGQPVYTPPGGLSTAPYGSLLGLPMMPLEYCSALGDEGDLILGNLKWYATGVKGGIQSASSIHLRFDYLETAFRWVYAVDGQPWLQSPQTPFKGSDTVSPFVTLEAR